MERQVFAGVKSFSMDDVFRIPGGGYVVAVDLELSGSRSEVVRRRFRRNGEDVPGPWVEDVPLSGSVRIRTEDLQLEGGARATGITIAPPRGTMSGTITVGVLRPGDPLLDDHSHA